MNFTKKECNSLTSKIPPGTESTSTIISEKGLTLEKLDELFNKFGKKIKSKYFLVKVSNTLELREVSDAIGEALFNPAKISGSWLK